MSVAQQLRSDRLWMTLWALWLATLPVPFAVGTFLAVYYAVWTLQYYGDLDPLWVWALIGLVMAALYCIPPLLLLRAAWTSEATLALRRRRTFWRFTMGLLGGTLMATPFAGFLVL